MVPVARIALTAIAVFTAQTAAADDQGRYEIYQGKISGFAQGDPPPVTILLDRQTGQTWMLALLGSSPQWLALSYNSKPPPNTLPPPPR